MPEYLAPGVYVEEVSFRSKSIEGVSTTTTGFVGPTRYGPVDLEPDVITSLAEYERVYGDRQQLRFGDVTMHNYMWHAARAFFEEGGKRLYVARTFRPAAGKTLEESCAHLAVGAAPAEADRVSVRARFPGQAGNGRVRLTLAAGQNTLGGTSQAPTFAGLRPFDLVWIKAANAPAGDFFVATRDGTGWKFFDAAGAARAGALEPNADPKKADQVRVVTLTVTVQPSDDTGQPAVWAGLALDPRHQEGGRPDAVWSHFAAHPTNATLARSLPLVFGLGDNVKTGLNVLTVLDDAAGKLKAELADPKTTADAKGSTDLTLADGADGERPGVEEYEGKAEQDQNTKTGLKSFEDVEDISIVAAPGSTFGYNEEAYAATANTVVNLLVSHAQRMRYRIAVLDSGDGQSIAAVRAMRAKLDSSWAALYYPWVRILDPVTRTEIHLPPSGFVAGIYARNDVNRAVYKAPANEVVNLAIGFEQLLNKSQQEVLNPEGINCFRYFEGRGFRLWGARTVSSDPEWKYVNLRRYFAYLERSIDRGTQWAVFEPNGEALWANVRRTIEDFLLNEWMSGALLGDKPERAYFVRCDRSTMTQNDLDNGRLVCLIGVAPLRPAEFVIFRIGQWTADRKA